jgi:hypothetical protein
MKASDRSPYDYSRLPAEIVRHIYAQNCLKGAKRRWEAAVVAGRIAIMIRDLFDHHPTPFLLPCPVTKFEKFFLLHRLAGEMVCHAWRSALYTEPLPTLSLHESPAFYCWLEQREPRVLQLDLGSLEGDAFWLLEHCCNNQELGPHAAEAQELYADVRTALQEHLDGKVHGCGQQSLFTYVRLLCAASVCCLPSICSICCIAAAPEGRAPLELAVQSIYD